VDATVTSRLTVWLWLSSEISPMYFRCGCGSQCWKDNLISPIFGRLSRGIKNTTSGLIAVSRLFFGSQLSLL
jgi:hypothetical protein